MPNLNPAVNAMGAVIEWRSGSMVVVNAYGFAEIIDNSLVNTGEVLLLPDEEAGAIDDNSFIVSTVLKPASAGVATDYTNTVTAQRKNATLTPDSQGRKYVAVQGHYTDVSGTVQAKVSFCIIVQKTVPDVLPVGSGNYPYGDVLEMTPLLVWSWKTPLVESWSKAIRLRALALGHAMGEAAGYRVVFYGDETALTDLRDLGWQWETRELPRLVLPSWFWSGSKMLALGSANEREDEGTTVLHVDADALVKGPLRDMGAALYADHEEHPTPLHDIFYPARELRMLLQADVPAWFDSWARKRYVSVCALVGGSNRDAVRLYIDEVYRVAWTLDASGAGRHEHTWFCEQAVHHGFSEWRYGGSGFALTPECEGKNFAHWPGGAKNLMPATISKYQHLIPATIERSIDERHGPMLFKEERP